MFSESRVGSGPAVLWSQNRYCRGASYSNQASTNGKIEDRDSLYCPNLLSRAVAAYISELVRRFLLGSLLATGYNENILFHRIALSFSNCLVLPATGGLYLGQTSCGHQEMLGLDPKLFFNPVVKRVVASISFTRS